MIRRTAHRMMKVCAFQVRAADHVKMEVPALDRIGVDAELVTELLIVQVCPFITRAAQLILSYLYNESSLFKIRLLFPIDIACIINTLFQTLLKEVDMGSRCNLKM